MTTDYPTSECPKCGAAQTDLDGFGVVRCDKCGYCAHPSETGIPGGWKCDICGREQLDTERDA